LDVVQCLDLRFLIQTEYNGVLWRVHGQADDIDDRVRELRIMADLECLQPVRPKVRRFPDLPDLQGMMSAYCAINSMLQGVASWGTRWVVRNSTLSTVAATS